MVEGGGLENRYGSLAHREFESLPLRQFFKFGLPDARGGVGRIRLAGLDDLFQDQIEGLMELSWDGIE